MMNVDPRMQTSTGTYSSLGAHFTENPSSSKMSVKKAIAMEQLAKAQAKLYEAHKVSYAEAIGGVSKKESFKRAQQNALMKKLTKAQQKEIIQKQKEKQMEYMRQQQEEQKRLRSEYLNNKSLLKTPWGELAFDIVVPSQTEVVEKNGAVKVFSTMPRVRVPLVDGTHIDVCYGWIILCLQFNPKVKVKAPCQRNGYCDHKDENHKTVICSKQLQTGFCPHQNNGRECRYKLIDISKVVVPTHFKTTLEGHVIKSAMAKPIDTTLPPCKQIDKWIKDAYAPVYLEKLTKVYKQDSEEMSRNVKDAENMIERADFIAGMGNESHATELYDKGIEILEFFENIMQNLFDNYKFDKGILARVSEEDSKQGKKHLTRLVELINNLIIKNAKLIQSQRFVSVVSSQTKGVLDRLFKNPHYLSNGFSGNKQLLFELFLAFQNDRSVSTVSRDLGNGLVDPSRPRINELARELARRCVICRSEFFVTLEKTCGFETKTESECRWSNTTCRNGHASSFIQCEESEENNRKIIDKTIKEIHQLLDDDEAVEIAMKTYLRKYVPRSRRVISDMATVNYFNEHGLSSVVTLESVRYTEKFVEILKSVKAKRMKNARDCFQSIKQIALFNPAIILPSTGLATSKFLIFTDTVRYQPILTDIIDVSKAFPSSKKDKVQVEKKVKQTKPEKMKVVTVNEPEPKKYVRQETEEEKEYEKLVAKVSRARTEHNTFASEARELKQQYMDAKHDDDLGKEYVDKLLSELKDTAEYLKELRDEFNTAQTELDTWKENHPAYMQALEEEAKKKEEARILRLKTQAKKVAEQIAKRKVADFACEMKKDEDDDDILVDKQVMFEEIFEEEYAKQLYIAKVY
jgi:hypothetical protein